MGAKAYVVYEKPLEFMCMVRFFFFKKKKIRFGISIQIYINIYKDFMIIFSPFLGLIITC